MQEGKQEKAERAQRPAKRQKPPTASEPEVTEGKPTAGQKGGPPNLRSTDQKQKGSTKGKPRYKGEGTKGKPRPFDCFLNRTRRDPSAFRIPTPKGSSCAYSYRLYNESDFLLQVECWYFKIFDLYLPTTPPTGSLHYPTTGFVDDLISKARDPNLRGAHGLTARLMDYQICCWIADVLRSAVNRQFQYLQATIRGKKEELWAILQEVIFDVLTHMMGCSSTKRERCEHIMFDDLKHPYHWY